MPDSTPDPTPVPDTPPRRRRPSRKTTFRILAWGSLSILVLFVALGLWVYIEAVRTFEVRRVSLPTRVFTDKVTLVSGAPVGAEELGEKLRRLGYRETDSVDQPGTFQRGEEGWRIHIRAFDHPEGDQEAQLVTVTTTKDGIETVTVADGSGTAALEPELLTSIMGDQLENRSPVPLDAIPQHVIDAVVVAEDVRFFAHPGVDPIGIFRALMRNIRSGGASEGGSTLTQQLVKNYYLTNERTMRRKIVEAFMALMLDAKYSKKEIVEAYLNDIYLGRDRSISILGVGQASRFYFGKPVTEATISEAAVLAGMIPSPNNFSPFANAEKSKERRDLVLRQMRRNGKITEEQLRVALNQPLPEKPTRQASGLGSIPYYVDRVLQEIRRDYGIEEVEGRGLQIYTAIDLEWQEAAAKQVEANLARLEEGNRRLRNRDEPLQGAAIAVDVATGEIRALVGGRNYEVSQFNRATSAKRQVGSLFKPFVAVAAFEPSLSRQNITPATLVNDARFVLERRYSKDWSPRNYEGHYYGVVTVRQALEKSMNSAFVRLGLSSGVDSVIKTASVLGVDTEMADNPALILGAVEVPPVQMAEAYTTLARMGSRLPLRTIRFVTDEDGDAVASGRIDPVQVFPARDVYLAVHLMEGVMNRGTGAGSRALGFRKTAAGKTGTTNDQRDAWFIGFTPDTLALTWIGFDSNQPVGISASDSAVPMWARLMTEITAGRESRDFPVPGGMVFAEVDATSGGLVTPQCPGNQVVQEAFKAGTEPRHLCPIHEIRQPMLVDAYGMPLPGMEGWTPLDEDPRFGSLPPTEPVSPPISTEPRPDPVLGGGNFPTRTVPPTSTRPPVRLPVPLPGERPENPPTSTQPTTTQPTTTRRPPARPPEQSAQQPPASEPSEPEEDPPGN
ncbi:MAG TPA: PBP1A family penicillin-binding protein [Thermoanaerobaculia bacterium]|nr:PBP1A family penicillin-binding protein [Thermoanaerobaculia bacterium]